MTNSSASPAKETSESSTFSQEKEAHSHLVTNSTRSSAQTPDKWFVGQEGNIEGQDYISISFNSPEGERTIALVTGKKDIPEPMANAELIAQAPTLLAENKKLKESNAELLYALEEARSVCYGAKEIAGNIANINHAIKLSDKAIYNAKK